MPPNRRATGNSPAPRRGEGWATITSVAKQAFDELGYHGVSIRDIAQRAGMSLSALYYYYDSKHDLLLAILERGIEDYDRILQKRTATAGSGPVARFDALVSGLLEYRATHRVESRLMLTELKYLDAPAREKLTQPQRLATKHLATAIADARAAGLFTTEYPDEARRAVWSVCNAIATWYDPDGPLSLDEIIRRNMHLAHLLVGYTEALPNQAAHTAPTRARDTATTRA